MSRLNAQINVADPAGLAVRVAGRARKKMFQRFLAAVAPGPEDTVLDVGVTSDRSYASSNYFEAWYMYKSRVVAVGLDDASFIASQYPGVRFVRADGRRLPFSDRSFDVVHSSAVIEHVGSKQLQQRFLQELCRVARRAVFITTPNRWFPVEFHTLLPLVHWLPQAWFFRSLKLTGRSAFATEDVLNLLDAADLFRLADIPGWTPALQRLRLLGWTSNLLLCMTRTGAAAPAH